MVSSEIAKEGSKLEQSLKKDIKSKILNMGPTNYKLPSTGVCFKLVN